MNKNTAIYIKNALAILFFAAVAYFLYRYIQNLRFDRLAEAELHWGYLALGLALGVGHKFLFPQVWKAILTGSMNARLTGWRPLYFVYAASWIGRYVPGKVAMVGARVLYAERVGVSRSQAAVSFLVEMGVQMLVWGTGALIFFALTGGGEILERELGIFAWAPLLFLVALYPPLLNFGLRLLFQLMRKEAVDVFIDFPTILSAASVHLTIFLLYGLYNYSLALAILPADVNISLLYVTAVFGGSLLVGMLVIFMPAGLGARESVQLALLGAIIDPAFALVIVVLHRVMDVGSDLIYFAVCFTAGRKSG